MRERYLEITFRKGKPLAAYLYLERASGARCAQSKAGMNGMVLDYDASGCMIGIELTAPALITAETVNAILAEHGLPPLSREELAPLRAA